MKARSDAVELKLKVLDDKLLRAQISEEEKLKVCDSVERRTNSQLVSPRALSAATQRAFIVNKPNISH